MTNPSEIQETFVRCEELVRLLVFAARGSHSARTRAPMELLAMHFLDGRLVYATHSETYGRLSWQARTQKLETVGAQLWEDVVKSRQQILAAIEARPPVCPSTRRNALIDVLLRHPIVKRADVAKAAKVSKETAGRWLERLRQRGLLRRLQAGNISVYFVAPLVLAVLRQLHLLENLPVDADSLKRRFSQKVVIAMDPYRSGYEVTGDVRKRVWDRY